MTLPKFYKQKDLKDILYVSSNIPAQWSANNISAVSHMSNRNIVDIIRNWYTVTSKGD